MAAKKSTRRTVKPDNDSLSILSLSEKEINARGDAAVRAIERLHAANKAAAIASDNAVTSNEIKNDKKVEKATGGTNSAGTKLQGTATRISGLQTLAKAATSSQFAETQGGAVRTAGAILGGIADSSAIAGKGLSALAGGVNAASIGFSLMTSVVKNVVSTFIEMYQSMQKLLESTVTLSMLSGDDIVGLKDYGKTQKDALNEIAGSYQFLDENVNVALGQLIQVFKNDKTAITELMDETLVLNKLGINLASGNSKLARNQYYSAGKGVETTNSLLGMMVNLSRQSSMSLEELLSLYEASLVSSNNVYNDAIASGQSAETAELVAKNFQDLDLALKTMAKELGLVGGGEAVLYDLLAEVAATATDPTKVPEVMLKGVPFGLYDDMDMLTLRDKILSGEDLMPFAEDILRKYGEKMQNDPNALGYMAQQHGAGAEFAALKGTFRSDDSYITQAITSANTAYDTIRNPRPIDALAAVTKDLIATMGDQLAAFWQMLSDSIFKDLDPTDMSNALKGAIKFFGGTSGTTDKVNQFLVPFDSLNLADLFKMQKPGTERAERAARAAELEQETGGPNDSLASPSSSASTSLWYTANDAAGVSPWRLTAGYLSPAYRARFGRDHRGVDYGAARGTILPSSVAGIVTATGYDAAAGNYVKVTDAAGYTHLYGHLDSIDVVKGQQVQVGTTLGRVGSTGRSTGPHVHYGVSKGGKYINPAQWARGTFSKGLQGGTVSSSTPTTESTVPATSAVASPLISTFSYQNNNAAYAARYGVGGPNTTPSAVSSQTTTSNLYDTSGVSHAINGLTQIVSSKLDVIIGQMVRQSLTKGSAPLENSFIYK